MGGKKEIYREVRFFHGAFHLNLHSVDNDSILLTVQCPCSPTAQEVHGLQRLNFDPVCYSFCILQ